MTCWKDWWKKRRKAKEDRWERLRLWELHENEYALEHTHEEPSKDHYDLYDLAEQRDEPFPPMVLAIMEELLAPFQVVTRVETVLAEKPKRGKTTDVHGYFSYRYHSGLMARGEGKNVYYDQNKVLLTLTQGLDLPLMEALLDHGGKESWSCTVRLYAYHAYPFARTGFQEIETALDRETCAAFVTVDAVASHLEIITQGGEPDWKNVLGTIRRICGAHGRTLIAASDKAGPPNGTIYECYRGRFSSDIGSPSMAGYTFGPMEPGLYLTFDADFFRMAELTFRALLQDCSVKLELSTGWGGAPVKKDTSLRLDQEFPTSYALFLESHGLYPGRVQVTKTERNQKLTLYFSGSDPGPLAAYFSHLRHWPDLGSGFWMECSGVLKKDAEEQELDKPDLHIFCSDNHPAMTIELAGAAKEAELVRRLGALCRENGKEFLCDFQV